MLSLAARTTQELDWLFCQSPRMVLMMAEAESVVEERASDLAFLHLDLEAAAPAGRVGARPLLGNRACDMRRHETRIRNGIPRL
eukprot:2197489-Amphidinium_carterae.1